MWSRQAWLQPMHVFTSSGLPAAAFFLERQKCRRIEHCGALKIRRSVRLFFGLRRLDRRPTRLPVLTLLTNSASAKKGLAMDTKSAWPLLKMSSTTCGMLMRLVATSGVSRSASSLSFLVTQLKAPRGTDVAMVGMRASCHLGWCNG